MVKCLPHSIIQILQAIFRVMSKSKTAEKQVSKSRTLLFKAIGILSPFILLLVIEVLVRICNYGNDLRLFTTYKNDNEYLVFNPAASKKYFLNQAVATTGNSE